VYLAQIMAFSFCWVIYTHVLPAYLYFTRTVKNRLNTICLQQTDEEQALSDSESEDEDQKKQDSRRSSKSSQGQDEENKSIDSGIR
jgi:hypothetical protein